jgi:serine/threonine protein kinase
MSQKKPSWFVQLFQGGAAGKARPNSCVDGNGAELLNDDLFAASDKPLPIQKLGRYKLTKKLGAGGMGVVYEAIQEDLDRRVALKIMPRLLMLDPDYLRRFKQEAKSAAALNHPNIVTIYETGNDRGVHFFSMEFVDGASLEQLQAINGRLPVAEAARYMIQAAQGLEHAWEHGIIHRDIKPANLMVNKKGILKIADFGLAKSPAGSAMTQTNKGMGTPHYLSPEQWNNAHAADERSDIYSLGATYYHLLAGRPPFEGETAIEVRVNSQSQPLMPLRAINPRIPRPVVSVVEKMLARRPEDRHQNAAELIAALDAIRLMEEDVAEVISPWDYIEKTNALYDKNQYAEALDLIREGIAVHGASYDFLNLEGINLSDMGRHADALHIFDLALQMNPRYVNLWANKGRTLRAMGRHLEALKCYDKAIACDPSKATPWHNKGNCLSDLERNEEALLCFEKAAELEPNHEWAPMHRRSLEDMRRKLRDSTPKSSG